VSFPNQDRAKATVPEVWLLFDLPGFKMSSRNTFLIDPDGKIVKVWADVSPARHSEEVLAALAQFAK
jgi:peroxiredoxin Q/BCP